MATPTKLVYEKSLRASPEIVFQAFTNATMLREWLADGASTDPHSGGRIILWWNDGYITAGHFTELEANQSLSYTWRGSTDPDETEVSVVLKAEGGSTQLELVHSGLGEGEDWDKTRLEFQHGWEKGLENLSSVLETGKDLRIYNRPMLGILLSDFNAEIAERLGVPVKEGVRVDGTLENMGARAAGLKQDDVIVELAGQDIEGYNDLGLALDGCQAGDSIRVVIYRGSERKSVQMTLSGRPIADFPWDAERLAALAEARFHEIDRELEAVLANATESEASTRPAEGEWSAKEILGHLILVERENIIFIADLLNGYERWSDDYTGNIIEPIQALLEVYPTLSELIAELKRQEAETVALLRHLPADFVNRKGSYWRVATPYVEPYYHTNTHLPQIKAAIEGARG
jgi:uncharacterized protein YndB with AHSA1/START domain